LIEGDEATMALDELEYARFKVRVSVGCEAKITSYMRINEVRYQISVEEECTVPEHKIFQCHWSKTSEGAETNVDSFASHASVRSGSGAFEDARKIVKEEQTVEMSNAPPLFVQDRRRSEPSVPLHYCEPFSAKSLGSISAPNICLLTRKENIGSVTPTAISRVDKAKKIGLSETTQCVSNQTPLADEEGRCILENYIEIDSKSGPNVCRVEDSIWFGTLERPLNAKRF